MTLYSAAPEGRLLLVAAVALAVTACGKKEEPTPPASAPDVAAQTAAPMTLEGQVDIVTPHFGLRLLLSLGLWNLIARSLLLVAHHIVRSVRRWQ